VIALQVCKEQRKEHKELLAAEHSMSEACRGKNGSHQEQGGRLHM
jgi:hypothetical protein